MKTNHLGLIWMVTFLAAFSAKEAHSQNLVVNGSFEFPALASGAYSTVSAGQPTLPSWLASLTSVDVVHQGYLASPAFDGVQYLDLDGTPGPGGISQSLTTTPGFTYQLSFAYANNFRSQQPSASATVQLFDSVGTVLAPVIISHGSSISGNLGWSIYSTTFTAHQSLTTLEFASLSGRVSGGILIDAVTVVPVPEPSTYALLACGAIGFHGLRMWRKRYAY